MIACHLWNARTRIHTNNKFTQFGQRLEKSHKSRDTAFELNSITVARAQSFWNRNTGCHYALAKTIHKNTEADGGFSWLTAAVSDLDL